MIYLRLFFLCTQSCQRGEYSIQEWTKSDHTKLEYIDVIRCVVRGIEQLHCMGIIHGDVKPGNVIFFKDRGESICKISDFDTCTRRGEMMMRFASMEYSAPEIHSPEPQVATEAIDMWSIGVFILHTLYPKGFEGLSVDTKARRDIISDGTFVQGLAKHIKFDRARRVVYDGGVTGDLLNPDPKLRLSMKKLMERGIMKDTETATSFAGKDVRNLGKDLISSS